MFPVFAAHAHQDTVLMFNTGPAFGEAIGSYRGDPLYHASLDPAEYDNNCWLGTALTGSTGRSKTHRPAAAPCGLPGLAHTHR